MLKASLRARPQAGKQEACYRFGRCGCNRNESGTLKTNIEFKCVRNGSVLKMLKSMTAYSFVEEVEDDVNVAIEMRTYNSRHLDMALRLPMGYASYEEKIKEIEELRKRESRGEIEIRYVDETGFCLTPYIPYCWQENKQTITVKSRRSKRLNVLGFLRKDNCLEAYTFYGSINSDVVIACIDNFCEKITKKTVLVMYNSSVHQNNLLWDKEEEWSKKGLDIFFCPHILHS